MDVDPSDYSVDELRDVAGGGPAEGTGVERRSGEHGFLWADAPGSRLRDVEIPSPEQRERVLALAGLDRSVPPAEPYLQTVPEGERVDEVVLEWLGVLASVAGYEGTLDAIERYRAMGWITEAAEDELREYMLGIDRTEGDGIGMLDRADHLLSFAHVAWLATRD